MRYIRVKKSTATVTLSLTIRPVLMHMILCLCTHVYKSMYTYMQNHKDCTDVYDTLLTRTRTSIRSYIYLHDSYIYLFIYILPEARKICAPHREQKAYLIWLVYAAVEVNRLKTRRSEVGWKAGAGMKMCGYRT